VNQRGTSGEIESKSGACEGRSVRTGTIKRTRSKKMTGPWAGQINDTLKITSLLACADRATA